MGLQCLIVTCDPTLLDQVKSSLATRGISLDFRQDSASAIELASRRHLDGLVIDCDDVPGGKEAIAQARNSRSNHQTLIFAVLNGSTSAATALDLGANFVLGKPVQENRWRSVLDIAFPQMEREHRRYFRYEVDLPVRFQSYDEQTFTARMKNVSEGGLAVKLADPVRLEGVVMVEFDLPSLTARVFQAKAQVVWRDSFVMGMRFLYIEKDSGVALRLWLDSLEAQFQFRESAQRTCSGWGGR
jgi:CheY-like chemotaxis protein